MINLKSKLKYYYQKLYLKSNSENQKILLSLGKLHSKFNKEKKTITSFEEIEFQAFSQRGEDGIIQYLINNIEIENKEFVEFGVENYLESNTRFLLMNDNWSGLVIDGSKENIKFIKSDDIYWKYNITAVHSFITRDNINSLIKNNVNTRDIGLLSIDIDGNDYWIWDVIDSVNPRVIVCEYNSLFGPQSTVSIPYSQEFTRTSAHYSNLYFGASLGAFCFLADKKGYDFVGATEAGVNAFFVRKDLSGPFKKYTSQEGFKESANRDSRDKNGKLSFLKHNDRLQVIKELPVVDVISGETKLIKDIFEL